MADFNLVYVFDPRDYLLEKLAPFLLLQAFPLHYIVEELTTPSIFHDQEQLLRSFNNLHPHYNISAAYLIKLNDVRVANDFQNVYFSRHALHI